MTTLAGTITRPDGTGRRGASFTIETTQANVVTGVKTVVAGEEGQYSMELFYFADAVYKFIPLSTGLPAEFFFIAPSSGTYHVLDLAPVGVPVVPDAAATLTAALNDHMTDATPHPNYDSAVVFTQATPAASWYTNHAFGRKVDVQVYVDNQIAQADVEVTDTYVHVTFASAQSGQLVMS